MASVALSSLVLALCVAPAVVTATSVSSHSMPAHPITFQDSGSGSSSAAAGVTLHITTPSYRRHNLTSGSHAEHNGSTTLSISTRETRNASTARADTIAPPHGRNITSGLDLYPEGAIFDSTTGFSSATNSSTPVDLGSGFISLQDAITAIDGAARETSTLTPSEIAGTDGTTTAVATSQNGSALSSQATQENGTRKPLTDGSLEHPIVVEAPLQPPILPTQTRPPPPAITPAVTTAAPASVPTTAESELSATQSGAQTAPSSSPSISLATTSVFTVTAAFLSCWFM